MPQHVPGQPADATTQGFNWDDPANRAEIDRLRDCIDIITRCRNIAAQEVDSIDDGESLLAVATARRMDLLANLPPFPLPGTLAPVGLWDLTVFFAFWQASLTYMSTPITVSVQGPPTVDHPDGIVPVTDSILNVFRRIMSGVGTW